MIIQPYITFSLPDSGGALKPISNGTIHIGEEGKSPKMNPIPIYYQDSSGAEVEISSPIYLNSNGVPVASLDNGAIISPYLKVNTYSIQVMDKNGNNEYTDFSCNTVITTATLDESIEHHLQNVSITKLGGVTVDQFNREKFSGDFKDLNGVPDELSGSYDDLRDKPVLFDGDYRSLSNKPTVATLGAQPKIARGRTDPDANTIGDIYIKF